VAVLIADTGYELYADLGLDEATHSVFDPELPEPGEV
jgi:hypothetical protein